MKVADAHCDTLTAFEDNPFFSAKSHWNLDKFQSVGGLLQFFAIFTPERINGDSALAFAFRHIGNFLAKKPDNVVHVESKADLDENKVNILLSLEGASPIVNDINNLYAFYKAGIRAMTLTWNHRNFVGDGVYEEYGLTNFGKDIVKEMDKIGMIIDVSHLNVNGFDDVCKATDKAFIASHSNSNSICPVPRNLFDYQIQEIINRKGFIGINLYSEFLGNNDENLSLKFVRHVEHFLNLGAEDIIGFGADYDGIDASPFIGVETYPEMIELLIRELNLGDDIIEKFSYKNLYNFVANNL